VASRAAAPEVGSRSEIDGEKSRSVTINGGRGRDGVARSTNGVVEGFFPRAGGDHLLDGIVDLAATLGIVLGQADAVLFGRERFADDLQLSWVLGSVAGEDDVVGGDSVDSAVAQSLDTSGVGVERLELDVLCASATEPSS